MMWTWISVVILIVGAAVNAEMEHQTAVDSTTGPVRPMGGARCSGCRHSRQDCGLRRLTSPSRIAALRLVALYDNSLMGVELAIEGTAPNGRPKRGLR
jgi:hypothetical protein